MIYEIRHRMEYQYGAPVQLEAHQLHLLPRTDAFQRVLEFSLFVSPEPSCKNQLTDVFGNPAHELWFNGKSDRLTVEALTRVETLSKNPFDYLVCESSVRLPIIYAEPLQPGLISFRSHEGEDPRVREFAERIAAKAGHETIGFLSELCLEIHRTMRNMRRDDGFPLPPAQTLIEKKGACRDLAVLFMACCRAQGLAARFTSGYAFGQDLVERDLHAWAEVYIEGGGWRGYDPTTGLAVCDQHVAISSAPAPRLAAPVTGTFRGNSVAPDFHTHISISLFSEARAS